MSYAPEIIFTVEANVSAVEFQQLLLDSGLAERRPVHDLDRLDRMLRGANLTVAARLSGALVGIARSVTDHAFCCYLSDLAVSKSVQGQGIGKRLIERTREEVGPEVSVILSSAPAAVGFYEAIGMPCLPDAFCYRRER